MSNKSRAFT